MTRLTVTYPDPERAVVDLLAGLLPAYETGVTVGLGVPTGWAPSSPTHVQVAWDGTPVAVEPVMQAATVRIVVRAATTTEAKRVAQAVRGMLLGWSGDAPVTAVAPLVGVQPARDPDTRHELAWFTVRVTVRSTPLVPSE